MFSLFKKPDKPEVTDMMYMTVPGKYHGLLEHMASGQTRVLVYYFKDTWNDLQKVLDMVGRPYAEINGSSCRDGLLNVIRADALR